MLVLDTFYAKYCTVLTSVGDPVDFLAGSWIPDLDP